MRRFELGDNHWSVTLSRGMVDIVWGGPGRLDQRHSRRFGSDQLASTFVETQIARQRALGYVEVSPVVRYAETAGDVPEPPTARSIRFECPPEKPTNATRRPQPAEFREIEQRDRLIIEIDGELEDATTHKRREEMFPTIAAASEAYEETVQSLREDHDWRQIRSSAVKDAAVEPELEAQCRAAPDDPAPWSVYADWLLEREDPLGQIAAADDTEASRLFGDQMDQLGLDREWISIARTHGVPRSVTIKSTLEDVGDPTLLAEAARVVSGAGVSRFIECLHFGLAGYTDNNDWGPTLRVLAQGHPERIRELYFNVYEYTDCEISWATMGDLSGLFAPFSNLEVLHLKSGAGGTLGNLELPNLHTFIRESGGLAAPEIASIINATWPRLAHLEIWFGTVRYNADSSIASISEILDGTRFRNLRHLGIVNCEWVEDAVEALATSAILPQLHSLDLSRGILARRGAALLVEHAARFRHLASLDLSLNLLEPDEVERVRGVLDNVIVTDQREVDYDYEQLEQDGETARYVAIGE